MVNCEDFKKLISKEIDGAITGPERDSLIRHLDTCRSCSDFRESLRSIHRIHAGLPEQEPPATMIEAVMREVQLAERGRRSAGWAGAAVAAAAVLVMIVGAGVGDFIARRSADILYQEEESLFDVQYLGAYPPDSMGDILLAAMEEDDNDQ